jgi:hypothetical protein
MNYRNLDAVRYIVKEATGLDFMYAYEDLVFPEHGVFLIQFDDTNPKNLFCFFQSYCNPDDKKKIYSRVLKISSKNNFTLTNKGIFNLEEKNGEIEIRFQ